VLTALETPPNGNALLGRGRPTTGRGAGTGHGTGAGSGTGTGAGAGTPTRTGAGSGTGAGTNAPGYRPEDFGTGPYGTGPIPTVPAAAPAPAAPGTGVRAASVDVRPDAEAERTTNGLRKRVRKDARPQGQIATPPRGFARPAESSVLDDSPDMVRSRLTAFRAGMERGQQSGSDSVSTSGAPRQSVDRVVEEPE
jgi:hypothetical protein